MSRAVLGVVVLLVTQTFTPVAAAVGPVDNCLGVVFAVGDAATWFSSAFVIADGGWVICTADSVTEHTSATNSQPIRNPIFISRFTGLAYECEVVAVDEKSSVALLKLPVKGLPAVDLGQSKDFARAGFGTVGELASSDTIGSVWPTTIFGVAAGRSGDAGLVVRGWNANRAFVTEIGSRKWLLLGELSPADRPIPNGSVAMRERTAVGMYVNRLRITDPKKEDVILGRCLASSELVSFAAKQNIPAETLHVTPAATLKTSPRAGRAFALNVRALSMSSSGASEDALKVSKELSELMPDDPAARMSYGVALVAEGKFEDAMGVFGEVEKLDREAPNLKTNRAAALIGLKRNDEAEKELLQAAKDAPGDTRPLYALVAFYSADEKTLEKALEYARQTVNLAPKSPLARLQYAMAYRALKKYKESIEAIQLALSLAPDWLDAWIAAAVVYEDAEDFENAQKTLETIADKRPEDASSLLALASFYVDRKNKAKAESTFAKIKALSPPQEILDAVTDLETKLSE